MNKQNKCEILTFITKQTRGNEMVTLQNAIERVKNQMLHDELFGATKGWKQEWNTALLKFGKAVMKENDVSITTEQEALDFPSDTVLRAEALKEYNNLIELLDTKVNPFDKKKQ